MRPDRLAETSAPDIVDVLRNLREDIFINMNKVKVCTVQSYNAATQRAEVTINIRQVARVETDGTQVFNDYPVLLDCPVLVLGGGSSYISVPITAGDTGVVLFNDRDMDNWVTAGGQRPPNTLRKHDLSDGLVVVGFRANPDVLTDVQADKVQIQYSTSTFMTFEEDRIDTRADEWRHDGSFTIVGQMRGEGGTINLDANLVQTPGREIHAGNGATGTFVNSVTVVDGIVVGGS